MQRILFGKLLKDERKRQDLTQNELAELAGNVCSGSYISYLERNYTDDNPNLPKPDLDIIDALGKALGLPLNVVRTSLGLSAQQKESRNSEMANIFAMLFVDYERLNPFYRQMAITLCKGVLVNLFEIQSESDETKSSEIQFVEKEESGKSKLPVIFAETEEENEKREAVNTRVSFDEN